MKLKTLLTAAAVIVLTLTGCTIGSDPTRSGSAGGSATKQIFADPNSNLEDSLTTAVGTMKGKRIAFIPILYTGYHLTENWGNNMKRTFEPMGAKVTVYDANFDPEKMVSTVDQLIRDKAADVLVLHNIDAGVLASQIEAAERAGIYTVVVNQLSNRLGDVYVGPNPGKAAEDIADRAITDCKAKGVKRVSIIDGPGNDAASVEWVKGITKKMDEAGFTVTEVAHSNYDNSTARNAAATTIQKQKSGICAFLVLFDLNSVSVGDAVHEAVGSGLVKEGDIGVYTFAADTVWCDALRKGTVTASAAYDVPGVGSAAITAIQQLFQMNQPAGTYHTVALVGHVIVDKSNVDSITSACYKGA